MKIVKKFKDEFSKDDSKRKRKDKNDKKKKRLQPQKKFNKRFLYDLMEEE